MGAPANDNNDTSARYASAAALDLSQIERELHKLWKDAAESSARSGGGPVVRACAATLVALCSNDIQFDHVAQTVERVALRRPCRAVLVRVDLDNKHAPVETGVSTVCLLGGPQQKRVCHEQIQIFAGEGSMAAIAPALLSLLVPDVPAYLWVPCEQLIQTSAVADAAAHADALFIDSHRFSEPMRALDRAASIAREHRKNRAIEGAAQQFGSGLGFGVIDLEWLRLRPWRDATAAAFDRPIAREILTNVQSLRIEYTAREVYDKSLTIKNITNTREFVTPALYAGWFASRVRWSLCGSPPRATGGGAELRLELNGPRRIVMIPRVDNDRAGALLTIEILAGGSRVSIGRGPGQEFGTYQIEAGGGAERGAAIRFATFDDVDALTEAIARAPRDAAFDRALPVALAFADR